MKLIGPLLCVALLALTPATATARWPHHGGHRGERHRSSDREYERADRISGYGARPEMLSGYGLRDARGRLRRSSAAKAAFERENPCPSTGEPRGPCPGYIVDHIIALKRGGPDDPSNMQWQTIEDAKAKDKIE